MITYKALVAIALATTCLVPLVAVADDLPKAAPADQQAPAGGGTPITGDFSFGLMGVAGRNPNQAGRYTGLNTTGLDVVGQFDLGVRAPWDSGIRYYEFSGNNLVFQSGNRLGSGIGSDNRWAGSVNNALVNSGSIDFRAGDQGIWGAEAYYNAITYTGNVVDSLYTTFGRQATLNNGLAWWGGATATRAGAVTAFTIPQLTATGAMQAFQTGTRRDILGGNFKFIYGNWTFTGAYRHEHKSGSLEESYDGNYGGMAFALPVDYDTDRYDASAAYNTRLFQGIFQYTFSHFSDNNNFVNLPYPTSNATAPFQRSAAYSTPPGNAAHYLTFMGATNIIPLTRLNINARVGLEKQDDTFAPNTGDPNPPASAFGVGLLSPTLRGTTANSLDAVATVYQLKVSATSHPIANTNTRIYYGLDGRNVSLNQYRVNVGGTGGQSDSNLIGSAFVVPQEWLKQNAGAEIGYRILPQYDTRLTVGYRYDAVERSNAQVGRSSTNTATVAVTSALGSQVNGKLSFDYSDRTGAMNYLGPWQYIGQGSTYSGAYYQAPMTSESVTFRTDYAPRDNLSGSIFLRFRNENYNYTAATVGNGGTAATIPLTGVGGGVKQDYSLTVGPDLNWRPSHNLDIHVFYTYEQLFYNNIGNGACSTAAQAATAACAGTAGFFRNQDTTSTHTAGISGDWKITEKLRLRGDYTISYGSVMFNEFNGVFVPNPTLSYQNVTNYPDITSLMHSLKLTATYEVTPKMHLLLQGIYTSFHNNDWNDTANAIQGAGTSAISILTPGYASPNYSIVMVLAGAKIRF